MLTLMIAMNIRTDIPLFMEALNTKNKKSVFLNTSLKASKGTSIALSCYDLLFCQSIHSNFLT